MYTVVRDTAVGVGGQAVCGREISSFCSVLLEPKTALNIKFISLESHTS